VLTSLTGAPGAGSTRRSPADRSRHRARVRRNGPLTTRHRIGPWV